MIFEGCKNMIFSGRKITIFRLMRPEKIISFLQIPPQKKLHPHTRTAERFWRG